jgi:uncharacterized lipoprotein
VLSRFSAMLKLGALIACGVALAGCHRHRVLSACHGAAGYQEARSEALLKYPPGLSAPNVTNALKIPDLQTPERLPRTAAEGCLDEPPQFVVPKTPPPQA